jgi:hypothetical protein
MLLYRRGDIVRILLVEDEIKIGSAVSDGLRAEGYEITGRRPAKKAFSMPARRFYDLIVRPVFPGTLCTGLPTSILTSTWRMIFLLSKAKKEGPWATIFINSFNVLNHPNDVTYIGVVSSPFFGQAVAAFPARRMQLGLEIKL